LLHLHLPAGLLLGHIVEVEHHLVFLLPEKRTNF
jgi:hypothetical protein